VLITRGLGVSINAVENRIVLLDGLKVEMDHVNFDVDIDLFLFDAEIEYQLEVEIEEVEFEAEVYT
jgi:hypothetical protein